ncbi:phophatidylserine decarboxylase associated domain-containing protein [Terasakiella sp. A23]|uniref:phophatidylserine decarboxylase associated domain-containing protein n=1 Tax=Terasakiella sp. FCG-A23 TaxID=3080561 RepID=UPI002952DCD4|nr:phophatidylserine decarboxylase associated domain-containing protein [Terasakiella sp. A23]MDV7340050.1 phophatidylserine decarboxylase associated domain-containing protein [Terasakiella sp. A23]
MEDVDVKETFTERPYPSCYRTGWFPAPHSESWLQFHETIIEKIKCHDKALDPTVQDLLDFLTGDPVVAQLMATACRQNTALYELSKKGHKHKETDGVPIPFIEDAEFFALMCDVLLTTWPHFINDDLVGLPFSAYTVGIDPTLAGSQLLGLPQFNEKMKPVLDKWHTFLGTRASAGGFAVEGEQWLSEKAKKSYKFDLWKKDNETLPYWNSWNSFFTREFKEPEKERPIAAPDTNQVVNCPNDGSLFRWDWDVGADNPYWFKDMQYSIRDILSSDDPAQQAVIDQHNLVDIFQGGYVFQTYLNPYNFHRWWVPANGEVLFDPISIPGAYFNKLVLPDYGGATTASLPYLTEVNARGLIVIDTGEYGRICCIPLGMSEVSTISFDKDMKKGAKVKKGQEMGMFNYGGSSFVMIFENLLDKELVFINDKGKRYPQQPATATNSAGTGGEVTEIGAQIGVWYKRK